MFSLAGKKALVIGIANEDSIAYGCAKAFRAQGADLAITYQNEKAAAFVRPIAEKLGTDILLPLDVREDDQFGPLFDSIRRVWGSVDICLHSIAFCPREDLHSKVVDCSRSGFVTAMDISVYSFIRMVRRAAPLMSSGGACMTVSFLGAERVVEHYNIMPGQVRARIRHPLYGCRSGITRHPRTCALAGAAENKGGIGYRSFRRTAGFCGCGSSHPPTRQH